MKKFNLKNLTLSRFLVPLLLLLAGHVAQAQGTSVRGTITDDKGDALPGVTVVLRGTAQGSISDAEGRYTLEVPSTQETLIFSYVGYARQEIAINNRSVIDVQMLTDDKTLNEVVVIGYGTQKRETVTGSIATVKSEDFIQGIIADPMTLITGKVAGLAVTRPNGSDPNATTDFSLRGAVSREGSAQPLIVIDGVPGGDLRTIAPQDIESIDVLKDGSAAAIYGSRATGGVVLVTTKRGRQGPARVAYTGYVSTDQITRRYDVLNAEQYRAVARSINREANDMGSETDWFNQLTRTPVSHGHNLAVSGGSGKTDYYAAVNLQNYQGMDLVGARRFVNGTFRLNTKALSDKLDFSIMLTNSFDNKTFADYYGFGQALNMNPTFPVTNPDGTYFEAPQIAQGSQWNPVANTRYNTNNSKEKRMLGTANLSYAFTGDLSARVSYSYAFQDFLSGSYTDNRLLYMQQSGINGQASRSQNSTTNNVLEGMLDYQKQLGSHNLNLLVGYSYQNIFNEGFGAGNNNFNTNAFLYYNLGAGAALNNLTPGFRRDGVYVNSFGNERTLLAYFGRLIYDYKEKYLLNVSFRREGASVLGADNKWGNFVGVSGGWILSNEAFINDVGFINNLKLRAGYGITGNQNSLSPYQSLATVGPFPWKQMYSFYGSPGDPNWILGYGPTINPNPSLTWETKNELNLGLDFSLFKSRISGSLDYYDRRINNLIGNYTAQLPPNIYDYIFANAGQMRNSGLELLLEARIVSQDKFRWNATFVGAQNVNKIVTVSSEQFFGAAQPITDIGLGWGQEVQRLAEGQPVGVFYGKKFAGVTDNGNWLFYNSEGQAVTSDQIGDDDYQYLGNSIPRFNLGLTNTIAIGRFDASILVRSALGFNVLNSKNIFHDNVNSFGATNLLVSAFDWVQDPNYPNTGRPEPKHRGEPTFSDYYLEKGDYMKLDNVTVGYTLPFKNLRVYATALNLAILTNYSGMDPELGINPFPGAGVEFRNYYPRTRTFTVGVSANF
ncbi:TonB-dependent receptor [Rhabdobacter roseus]|uniref:TonB-linked SusC/RagA family outer membrane protein n=1 Tax=Rhabdobacter roseus TaxID=1655419 RepID=A0A840TVW4_9BACT|nr:SusC/RagA family TonB-linked outer membrane protein [Rhabdobacter roseus]MBB5287384.1 TonB-linked SusC/RagA family outer membrane protein [Rhabdobacter roseus]